MNICVASATANTGGHTVRALVATGKANVRALTRDPTSAKAQALAALEGVTVVKGDFEDAASLDAALNGCQRAFLVCAPGSHGQFDMEIAFLEAAKRAGIEVTVRISAYTMLLHPATTIPYARAHYGIRAYVDYHKLPVVDLCPSWFMDNILQGAGEAVAAGTLSYPCNGEGKQSMIDTRDIGTAAATILLAPSDVVSQFVGAGQIEVHGPKMSSYKDQLASLSTAVGYEITFNQVTKQAWVDTMVGYGLPALLAGGIASSIQMVNGEETPMSPRCDTNSPLLLAAGWSPQYSVDEWAQQAHVQAAYARAATEVFDEETKEPSNEN